jgi:hypothetical protein
MKQLLVVCNLLMLWMGVSANSILITGADLYGSTGVLVATPTYIEDGVITALGDSSPNSTDVEFDGAGKSTTARLFNGSTHIGAIEVEQIEQT